MRAKSARPKARPRITSQIASNNRRSRLLYGRTRGITLAEWKALCAKYGNRCLACKRTTPLTVDHVIPLSRGGSNTIRNIQPICQSCNSRKGTKSTDYRTKVAKIPRKA